MVASSEKAASSAKAVSSAKAAISASEKQLYLAILCSLFGSKMPETKKAAAARTGEDFKRAQSAPFFSPVMCQELPGIGLEITIEQDAGSMVQVPIPQPTCKMQGPSSAGSPKISNANTYKMCR